MSERQEHAPSVGSRASTLIGTAAAAKGVLAAGLLAAILGVLAIVLGCASIGAAFQSSTAVWPVPLATRTGGGYQATGWSVTSRFGWRDAPLAPGVAEFHDGVDLAGPALCRRCPVAALFDAEVTYVGWDDPRAATPADTAGGQTVRIESGEGAYEVLYAHLEPYRLYVQLQGRVEDRFGRYAEFEEYAPIGRGELTPDGEISIRCEGAEPHFVASRLGPGTVLFEYDRPATCRTSVTWGRRGAGWQGWIPDEPRGAEGESVALDWSTPVDTGRAAGDVALRFRAHLTPPPPPPTATPAISTTERLDPPPQTGPEASAAEEPATCELSAAGRCSWRIATIPFAADVTYVAAGRGGAGSLAAPEQTTPEREPGTPTPTREGAPQLAIVLTASRTAPAIGQLVNFTASVYNDGTVQQGATVRASFGPGLEVLDVSPSSGHCAEDGTVACDVQVGAGRPATVRITARVRAATAPHTLIAVRADAEAGESAASDEVVIKVADLVIDEPWPPTVVPSPTQGSSVTPASPVPIAPTADRGAEPLTAPCYQAVAAALSRQGARYSQGGALADDPRGADGLPLPRTGPASFDCSGLVWWAYAQAGIPVGRTTYEQLDDGVLLPCTLDDLRGALTNCWAPGDLVFLRYPTGRHVAIYAGNGLFMDCFNHRVGCVLHDVSRDPFYRAHFLQARRIVWGCEEMALDPGAPVPPPLDGEPQGDAPGMCVSAPPSFATTVETLSGCGPPVRLGDRVFLLDSTVGFVGLSGATTGPHLHLGLRARSYDGRYHATDVCTPDWLRGRVPPPDADCWTEMADPLDFLPRALGGEHTADGTPIPADAPYQLPPPGESGTLVRTPVPGGTPVGQYWSPHREGGRYGGAPALEWLRAASCAAWKELPWCK